jgi:hypothetical protein
VLNSSKKTKGAKKVIIFSIYLNVILLALLGAGLMVLILQKIVLHFAPKSKFAAWLEGL